MLPAGQGVVVPFAACITANQLYLIHPDCHSICRGWDHYLCNNPFEASSLRLMQGPRLPICAERVCLQLTAREPPRMVTPASLIPLPYFLSCECDSLASERVSYLGLQTKIANHFNFMIAASRIVAACGYGCSYCEKQIHISPPTSRFELWQRRR